MSDGKTSRYREVYNDGYRDGTNDLIRWLSGKDGVCPYQDMVCIKGSDCYKCWKDFVEKGI